MLKRLQVKLEAKFRNPRMADEAGRAKYQKAVSRALWGIYCFERYLYQPQTIWYMPADVLCTTCSISASVYLQPSLVQAPAIPRRFVDNGSIDPAVTGHRASEPEPQLSAYVLSATCDLSEKLHESMLEYGRTGIDTRIRLYQDLRRWRSNMPSLIRADTNFCPETSLLR